MSENFGVLWKNFELKSGGRETDENWGWEMVGKVGLLKGENKMADFFKIENKSNKRYFIWNPVCCSNDDVGVYDEDNRDFIIGRG